MASPSNKSNGQGEYMNAELRLRCLHNSHHVALYENLKRRDQSYQHP